MEREIWLCTFSCRYLPPEIGCLSNLEFLDLSFNKIKSLPNEITYLNALISLKVSNNKLVELPSSLSSLQLLESLDLSNNRLTSLGSLELTSMHNLQHLNLQVFFYEQTKIHFFHKTFRVGCDLLSVSKHLMASNIQFIDCSEMQ